MNLIYVKDVDKSLLYDGFTIRTSLLGGFIHVIGQLAIGESKPISILLGNTIYSDIEVKNLAFNRQKYPNHPEMYQVRYTKNHPFAKAIRAIFPDLVNYVAEQQKIKIELKKQGVKTPNVIIPDNLKCSLAFYATTNPNVWQAEPIFQYDFQEAKVELKKHPIEEAILENGLLNDETASIVQEQHLVKIRKLDRRVCNNLKHLYSYRCQICGALITEPYGDEKHVIEAHHIDPFSRSLNNNYDNIMILCPNHHRILHAYEPEFKVRSKEFVYPNGYREGLKLNFHL